MRDSGHAASERDLWLDDFDTTLIQTIGQEWPDAVLVNRWQFNGAGERRFVDSRFYPAPTEAQTGAPTATDEPNG